MHLLVEKLKDISIARWVIGRFSVFDWPNIILWRNQFSQSNGSYLTQFGLVWERFVVVLEVRCAKILLFHARVRSIVMPIIPVVTQRK